MLRKLTLILLLGFIALNTNLFAIKENKEMAKTEKLQISKKDCAKVIAAGLGLTFFGTAGIGSFLILKRILTENDKFTIPSTIIFDLITKGCVIRSVEKYADNIDKAICVISGLTVSVLGFYLYKKISEFRNKKQSVRIKDQNKS